MQGERYKTEKLFLSFRVVDPDFQKENLQKAPQTLT